MIRISASRYSAVAATAALVISLGGTSYAVTQIGTAQLKNGAVTSPKIKDGQVTSADVRNNALTGADIVEQKLGRVPRAADALTADHADTAGDAATVGGNIVQQVRAIQVENPEEPVLAYNSNDLDIELRCSGSTGVDLIATTDIGNGTISTVVVGDFDPQPGQAVMSDLEDGTFAKGAEFDLLAGGDGDINQVTFVYNGTYGSVVTGTLQANYTGALNSPCRVTGFVNAYQPPRAE